MICCAQRLPLSCATPIDRDGSIPVPSVQKRRDLEAAQRRQLERLVGPQFAVWLSTAIMMILISSCRSRVYVLSFSEELSGLMCGAPY